jgi:hypothetical protein
MHVDDSRTLRCQTPGYRRANPEGGPGDEGNLFGQTSVPDRFHACAGC